MPTVAIFGATGAVGREMLRVLEARDFPAGPIRLLATARSAGTEMAFRGQSVVVEDIATADLKGIDIAFLAAGGAASRELAPRLVERGAFVVDNSSAFRMDSDVPLVVPAINGRLVAYKRHRLIANPNCSTTILLMPLAPLHARFGLSKVVVSTYQAVSGAGQAGVRELERQIELHATGEPGSTEVFGLPIHLNLLPQIGPLGDDGFCQEERKIVTETHKILGDSSFTVVPTTVRVPTMRCHAESVYVETRQATDCERILAAWGGMPGLSIAGGCGMTRWPTPRELAGRDETEVGRLRAASADGHCYSFYVVGDQLLRGAALNAVEIGELLV